tara:strand:+ start:4163 stop:5491 length:1329 start_codon:yes stop_codon:yes gene_type:complete
VVSCTQQVSAADAVTAVAAAVSAFPEWRAVTFADRVQICEALLGNIAAQRQAFVAAIASETGKTQIEADQELQAGIAEFRAHIQIFEDGLVERVGEHQVAHLPIGAVLLVTPSNFPLAATLRKLSAALLAGNTLVVKASELTPVTAQLLFAAIDATALPAGVANLVLADGRDVIAAMVAAPGLAAVSLTGSNAAGDAIAAAIGSRNIRFQAELGGCNAVVVLADADLDRAVSAVVEHGFACCGQWCTGTTRVIVAADVYEDFTERLKIKTGQIVVGSNDEEANGMGAMISAQHRQALEETVQSLCAAGAEILCGGSRPDAEHLQHGYYYSPTILAVSSGAHDDEIFGPVILVQRAADANEALVLANAGPYGLSFSVFTADPKAAEECVSAAEAGLCHVNLGSGYRDSAMPLAGWKASGRGIPECGNYARDFFTQTKAIYRAH